MSDLQTVVCLSGVWSTAKQIGRNGALCSTFWPA